MWQYYPEFFAAQNIQQAKEIILSGANIDNKWHLETTKLVNTLIEEISITEKSIILDYGCGVGRIAKQLIEQTGCTVFGVDISPNMLALSFDYVKSPNFIPCFSKNINILVKSGLKFDLALAVLVLQHCAEPQNDIKLIHRALKTNGHLYLFNEKYRCVPVYNTVTGQQSWGSDDNNIHDLLTNKFTEIRDISMDNINPNIISKFYQKTKTKQIR